MILQGFSLVVSAVQKDLVPKKNNKIKGHKAYFKQWKLIKQKNKHNIQQLFLPVLTSFMAIMIVKTYVKQGIFF